MEYYCVYVKSGKEAQFRNDAAAAVLPLDDSAEFYFFSSRLWKGKASRLVKEDKPLFPCYVFFKVRALTTEIAERLRKLGGFGRFLMSDDNIQQLRGADYDVLQKLLVWGQRLPMSRASYKEGERIKILSGPLKDFEAQIYHVDRRSQRVIVQVSLFGGVSKMELSYENVGKV